MTTTKKNLFAKLVEVAQAIDHVEKGGRNTAQSYDYVRAVDVARIVRKELSDRGVVPITSTRVVSVEPAGQTRSGAIQYLTTIAGTVTFHDSESSDLVSFDIVGQGIDTGDKGIYKAITGALKYALTTAFLIPNEADDPEVTRKDEIEELKSSAPRPTVQRKAKTSLATEDEKAMFVEAAEAAGLTGDYLRAFVGIVTGGKPRNETTSADIDTLMEKLADAELVAEVLGAKVAA